MYRVYCIFSSFEFKLIFTICKCFEFQNAVFGEGVYLSSELSVCLHYSPFGAGWENSRIGHQISCVALCEIIDDPSVKCKVHG